MMKVKIELETVKPDDTRILANVDTMEECWKKT